MIFQSLRIQVGYDLEGDLVMDRVSGMFPSDMGSTIAQSLSMNQVWVWISSVILVTTIKVWNYIDSRVKSSYKFKSDHNNGEIVLPFSYLFKAYFDTLSLQDMDVMLISS